MPSRLDRYVGGRMLWLTNILDPKRLNEQHSGATLTATVIGGRIEIDINHDRFVLADGSVGGFGADTVSFRVSCKAWGYRLRIFGLPTTVELGYQALQATTQPHSRIETHRTSNGPFAGLTAY